MIPIGRAIRIFNVSQFSPRQPPKFPLDTNLASLANKLSLDDDRSHPGTSRSTSRGGGRSSVEKDSDSDPSGNGNGDGESGEDGEQERRQDGEEDSDPIPATTYPPPAPLAALFDSVEGYDVFAELPQGGGPPEMPDITTCAMGFEGLGVVGIGEKGTLYVWRLR